MTHEAVTEVQRDLAELLQSMRKIADDERSREVEAAFSERSPRVDFVRVESTLKEYADVVERWNETFRHALTAVEELQRRARWARFDDEGWEAERQRLHMSCATDGARALREFAETYAQALAHWELEFCERLVLEPFALPAEARELHDLFVSGTQAIRAERFGDAEPLLEMLVGARDGPDEPLLDDETRGLLLVMLGRIETYDVDQQAEALAHLEEALQLAPADGRTSAGLGDYHREHKAAQEAESWYQRAIQLSPTNPQGYVGMGLLAEDARWWDEADDWYEQAMPELLDRRDVQQFRRALRALRAPASGNVYLELARVVRKIDPEVALDAVERAIAVGVQHSGTYPERIAYKLKGRVLERLDRAEEAAAAYFEAGWRFYSTSEFVLAAETFERADGLAPRDPEVLRYWADTLLVLSQREEPPFVDQEHVERAIEVWDRGAEPATPTADNSWAFVSRARMAERLTLVRPEETQDLIWQAVSLVERALVHQEDEALRWAILAQLFRTIQADMNSLLASGRAIELDPDNVTALEERAAILANVGRLSEADAVIDRCRELAPGHWVDAVKAHVAVYQQHPADALPLLNGAIEAAPENMWYRELRATCYDLLHDDVAAKQENQAIWDRYDPDDANQRSRFAWAAYGIGEVDTAIEIFESLREQMPVTAARCLALCHAAKGAFDSAAQEMERVLAGATSPFELETLLDVDFATLKRRTRRRKHSRDVSKFIREWTPRVNARHDELGEPAPPERELEEIVSAHYEERGWPWVGAQASLGRLHLAAGRWNDAAAAYAQLSGDTRFPETEIALAHGQIVGTSV